MDVLKPTSEIISIVNRAIDVSLEYEKIYDGKRKLGITGEIGEILSCVALDFKLVLNTIHKGYDAIDNKDKCVQIKSCRSETLNLSPNKARLGSFSKHKFDYAILVLLGRKYEIIEIWKADYKILEPILSKLKKRNPNIGTFKKISKQLFPK